MSRKQSPEDHILALFSEPIPLEDAKSRLRLARAIVYQRESAQDLKERSQTPARRSHHRRPKPPKGKTNGADAPLAHALTPDISDGDGI